MKREELGNINISEIKGWLYLMRSFFAMTILGLCLFLFVNYFRNKSSKETTSFVRTFTKAGAPDQLDETDVANLENSKMVSEGSQFGVQYFNKFMND